jgi:hypothetical protein
MDRRVVSLADMPASSTDKRQVMRDGTKPRGCRARYANLGLRKT